MLSQKFLGLLLFLCSLTYGSAQSNGTQYLPTVMWHGMGDSCCNPFSMGRIKQMIEDQYPGIYVYSVMVGNNVIADTEHGFLGNVNDQVQEICDIIKNDPQLQGGFDAMGFSQGGQFLRALVQRCPDPPIHNFISIGGQHQGVFGVPDCKENNTLCEEIRRALNLAAYIPTVQNHLVQAQYWHDSLNEEAYRLLSHFLSDINNEVRINDEYVTNLQKLSNFVLVKFNQDMVVIPRESEWFGFYTPGQDHEVQMLNETRLYTEDRLGLQAMEAAGQLTFIGTDGDHLEFTDQWFIDTIVTPYLGEVVSN